MKGIDRANPITLPYAKRIKAEDGRQFIGRYLGAGGSWKLLTVAEVDVIRTAGLWILSVFERYANRTTEGASAGTADGMFANDKAKLVGQPEGSAIYFCVDYDAPVSDYDTIEQYLRAAKAQIPDYRIGVYGKYAVVEEMLARGVVDLAWQTLAWSRGKISNKIALYQEWIDKPLFDQNADSNILYTDPVSAGMWGLSIPEEDDPVLKEQIAQLEQRIAQLEAERQVETPSWAQVAIDDAVEKGIVSDPNGDYTWKRVIAVLKKLKLF